ncbi:MAG TPA: hypothetical protein VF299_10290 [Mycobacterium sp.]
MSHSAHSSRGAQAGLTAGLIGAGALAGALLIGPAPSAQADIPAPFDAPAVVTVLPEGGHVVPLNGPTDLPRGPWHHHGWGHHHWWNPWRWWWWW